MAAQTFTPLARGLLGAFGAGSFGTGVYAVLARGDGTGTGVLLAFGGVLLVVALLGERPVSLKLGDTELRFRAASAEAAVDRLALAAESERRGDPAEAARLRAQAEALLDVAGPLAAEYGALRRAMPSGRARTAAMESVVAQAHVLARGTDLDPAAVRDWLRDGDEEQRVTALALMRARPELRDFHGILTAIQEPRTPFEHFQSLRLAKAYATDPATRTDQLWAIAATVRAARRAGMPRDSDRRRMADRVLELLDARLGFPGSEPPGAAPDARAGGEPGPEPRPGTE
jgi:hypothetical protein